MPLHYDPSEALFVVASRFTSTIVQACFLKAEFWLLIVFNWGVAFCWYKNYIPRDEPLLEVPWDLMKIATGLLTFFIVFYTNHCFARYSQLYELVRAMLGLVQDISSELMLRCPDAAPRRRALKYIFAGIAIFFHGLGHEDGEAAMQSFEVSQLRSAQLLTEKEIDYIADFEGPRSFTVMHWALECIRTDLGTDRERYLKPFSDKVFKIRRNGDEIIQIMDLPMPFQYFHILNLMLSINLILWGYGMGCMDTFFAPAIYFVTTLIFLGMRELSGVLSNPFGDDEVDFPLTTWLLDVYNDVVYLLEHSFACDEDVYAHFPFQLIVDEDEQSEGPVGKWLTTVSDDDPDIVPIRYDPVPDVIVEPEPQSAFMRRPGRGSK
mmetsp:Transcript_47144/g.102593  ORF Transcript_47144/g.102593 Transcript_47144/m.102593 type:complete len:378 (+) Transcript_47144:45-1178(+)